MENIPNMATSQSQEAVNVILCDKWDFADVISQGNWEGEIILGYLRGPDIITRLHLRGWQESSWDREFEDAALLALETEEQPQAKECRCL